MCKFDFMQECAHRHVKALRFDFMPLAARPQALAAKSQKLAARPQALLCTVFSKGCGTERLSVPNSN